MTMSKVEELRKRVEGTNFHLNLKDGSEITEEIAESALKFLDFVEEKKKNERS